MKRSFFILILVLCFLGRMVFAQGVKDIQVKTTRLGDNVYMMATRAGGNLGVCIGEDGVFLIDSEYAQLNDKVKAAIAAISKKSVKFVINTHWHFDHVGGNENFAKSGSLIAAHENVRKRMAADQHIKIIGVDVPASPKEALPVITFTNAVTFYCNGEEIALLHMPNAHTDGDSVVLFRKANVVHTGDIVFNRGYPFIDISNGGSINGMIAAVEAILEICDDKTKIIPGHGPLSNKAELETYGAMLREFRTIVAREVAAGKDLAAIQAAKSTAALDKKWGRVHFPPDKFTEMVFLSIHQHNSLKK